MRCEFVGCAHAPRGDSRLCVIHSNEWRRYGDGGRPDRPMPLFYYADLFCRFVAQGATDDYLLAPARRER